MNVCQEILVGDSNIVLAGGTDNMSAAPFSVRDIRFGVKVGVVPLHYCLRQSGLKFI